MATKTITWSDGTTATLTFNGQGNGSIVVTGDPNNHYESRSAEIVVKTTDGSNIRRTVTIVQAAKVRTDISNAVVTAANQTYSGSALTPTPTVTLNGTVVPSSGYDVAYSNNTNAGTATITITGKNDYTGTATGTFTIAKANPTYTAPTVRTGLTYSGSSQYLVNAGSTSHGTIQYSSNGTTWSTTRPSSTNAGSYTTYWRLVGDSNHNDVASTSLSTTIAKASRTLSFADSYVVLDTSSNVTKTATPSAGSGDGAITYSISSTTYATINSSSGKVTSKTIDGSAIVTATIAEGTNYLSASTSYTLYVFATTHDYSYNGSYRNVTLPPGTYQLQCWGAQGGSNAAASSYGITAKAGGKGGYSTGQLTISQATAVRVYVGGQGSASAGGYNGGGSTTGSCQYDNGSTFAISKMGGGGGATDIRLSNGSLYSRMIVAGGGSGGAMCYRKVTSSSWKNLGSRTYSYSNSSSGGKYIFCWNGTRFSDSGCVSGKTYKVVLSSTSNVAFIAGLNYSSSNTYVSDFDIYNNTSFAYTMPSGANKLVIDIYATVNTGTFTMTLYEYEETSTVVTHYQVGYVGGGTTGGGNPDSYKGKQNAGGDDGTFGQGENQTADEFFYASGAGGGGWYGGGASRGTNSIYQITYSGGGSGWVNTAASAGNRPSGFSSLQLDSGTTYDGDTSFLAPGGGNETGHAGNGYARITRLS